jgi:hypothetical protein
MCAMLVYVQSWEPFICRSNQRLMVPVYLQLVVTMVCGMSAGVVDDGDDTQRFVGFIVVGTAAPLLAVLVYSIFDPDGLTAPARIGTECWNRLLGKSKQQSIQKLRPLVDAVLRNSRLEWGDFVPLVNKIGTIEEINHAIADPVGFFEELKKGEMKEGNIREQLVGRLQGSLAPTLKQYGLMWADTLPIVENFRSYGQLFELIERPKRLLERMAIQKDPAMNKKLIIGKFKPSLMPELRKHGIEWAEVLPVLCEFSAARLRSLLDDPLELLDQASAAPGLALGMRIGQSLKVLEVLPRYQANRKGIHAGDTVTRLGDAVLQHDGEHRMDTAVAMLMIAAKAKGAELMIGFDTAEGETREVTFSLRALMDHAQREQERKARPPKTPPRGPSPMNGPGHLLSPRPMRPSMRSGLEAVAEASTPISIEDLDMRLTLGGERYPNGEAIETRDI